MDASGEQARSLYEDDFYGWTRQQAALLRAGKVDLADIPNLIEELETLGRSELSALRSSYRLVAVHLLKMRFQPTHRMSSWQSTIVRERNNIEDLLRDNPGLRPRRGELADQAYNAARREASSETKMPLKNFPADCPFSADQVEAHDFWP